MGAKDEVTTDDIYKISTETSQKFALPSPGNGKFIKDVTVYQKSNQEVCIIIHSAADLGAHSCFPNESESEIIDFVNGRILHYSELHAEQKQIAALNPENATNFPQLATKPTRPRAPLTR